MAQTQILASGTTPATSSDVVLTAGAVANIIGFTTSGQWSSATADTSNLSVMIDTNGDDQLIAVLNSNLRGVTVQGPGTFRVVRGSTSIPLGVTSET